jgi:hypothetical protein
MQVMQTLQWHCSGVSGQRLEIRETTFSMEDWVGAGKGKNGGLSGTDHPEFCSETLHQV